MNKSRLAEAKENLHGTAPAAAATPLISGFSPVSGPPSTVLTILGKNFFSVEKVMFNGKPAPFQTVSAQEILAAVPAGATTGPIAVTTGAGTTQSKSNFRVSAIAGLAINDLIPVSGEPGDEVAIMGQGFVNVTAVTFAALSTRVNDPNFGVESSTRIDCLVPALAKSGLLIVSTKTGASAGTEFTVGPRPNPEIDNFTPTSGPVGTSVHITGKNFEPNAITSVAFNGVNAPFTVTSSTDITAKVPKGATTGLITVTTGSVSVASKKPFTVT